MAVDIHPVDYGATAVDFDEFFGPDDFWAEGWRCGRWCTRRHLESGAFIDDDGFVGALGTHMSIAIEGHFGPFIGGDDEIVALLDAGISSEDDIATFGVISCLIGFAARVLDNALGVFFVLGDNDSVSWFGFSDSSLESAGFFGWGCGSSWEGFCLLGRDCRWGGGGFGFFGTLQESGEFVAFDIEFGIFDNDLAAKNGLVGFLVEGGFEGIDFSGAFFFFWGG